MNGLEKIQAAASYLQSRGVAQPEVGVILSTGLGATFADRMKVDTRIAYQDIPHFPVSTVESHLGQLLAGSIGGKSVLAMQGRFHFYEGYAMEEIVLPVRVMKVLGVQYLLISNAAGNLRKEWHKGEFMLIEDHISLLPDNPLRGTNMAPLGPRFPDMSAPYNPGINALVVATAAVMKIPMRRGVYAAVPGPSLETRAEYRYLRGIGADAVGMSTVPEVIAAAHASLPCAAVSVLTDDCDPDHLEAVDIRDIITVARVAEPQLSRLFEAVIANR